MKGRAAINDDNFTQFQIAQPFKLAEGETYNNRIKDEIAQMNEHYVGDYPSHIPMMPEKVLKSEVIKRYDINTIIKEDYKLPLGLDFEDVELVSLDLKSPSIIAARAPKDLDLINQVVLEGISQLKEQTTTILIDADGNMSDKEKYVRSYYTQPEELIYIKQGFNVEIKNVFKANVILKIRK